MKKSLNDHISFAEAIARLLHPFAEVAIHDCAKDQIVAIFNPISRRAVGDPSYLDRMDFDTMEEIIGPYPKTNWDGRPLKSISITIRNHKQKVEGFLCINLDVSTFHSASQILQTFLGGYNSFQEGTRDLFQDDHYENINLYIQSYCRERQVTIEALARKEKQELVHALAREGAFQQRNTASYIARVLGISRATVYNYLKDNVASLATSQ